MNLVPNFHDVEISDNLVEELRSKFLLKVDESPEKYDPIDVEQVKSPDQTSSDPTWHVRRFLAVQRIDHPHRWGSASEPSNRGPVIDAALDHMKQVYRWRAKHEVNKIYANGLAGLRQEYFTVGDTIFAGPDQDGRIIWMCNSETHTSTTPDRQELDVHIWSFEALDRELTRRRNMTVMIGDLRRSTTKNLMVVSRVKVSNETVGACLVGHNAGTLVVGLPTILKPAFAVLVKLMSGEAVRNMDYVNADKVEALFGDHVTRLPDYFLGPDRGGIKSRVLPAGTLPLAEILNKEMETEKKVKKEVDEYVAFYEKVSEKLTSGPEVVPIDGTTDAYLKHFLSDL